MCDVCYREREGVNNSSDTDQAKNSVTGRYISENLTSAMGWMGGAFKYPTKLVNDATRPEYWTPDHLIINCCVCDLEFGTRIYKHHCRSCGQGVCEDCSKERRVVPDKGWDYAVRVCDECFKSL